MRLEEEKEAAEALKQKTKLDTLLAQEVQKYKESDTKIVDLCTSWLLYSKI